MARVYNFSAGPSMLPEKVLKQAQAELLEYGGSGQSVMEMSHRSKWFDAIITDTEATLPLTEEALELCGERNEGLVFKGLQRHHIQYPLKKWLDEAGIDKHITFHCFRHTFATLQVAGGTDIYTVQHLLTHKNVGTTQIYADIVDEKMREASGRIKIKEETK